MDKKREFIDVDCEIEKQQGLPPSTLSLLQVLRKNKLREVQHAARKARQKRRKKEGKF